MTRDPHLTWKGSPKIAYATGADAQTAIPAAAPHQRMWEPTAYRCVSCQLWHIGNDSPLPEWPLRALGATVSIARTDHTR